jgi:hypothetical protein
LTFISTGCQNRLNIKNPTHPEHEDTMEWLGDDFDPEEFDPEETNEVLRKMR